MNEQEQEQYEEMKPHKVPEDSPYSPLYNPNKDKNKKNGNRITAILIALLIIFLVIALIAAVSKLVKTAMFEIQTSSMFDKDYLSEIEEFVEEKKNKGNNAENSKESNTQDGDYIPSEQDTYYSYLVDAIDTSLSYGIEKENYSYADEEKNVDIQIEYPLINGDSIINQEKINEQISAAAEFYLKNYAAHPEKGNVSSCQIKVQGYVTYMSEETLSVVLDERFSTPDISYLDLYCINVDIPSGQVLDNSNIVTYSEELAKEFKKISRNQNGEVKAVEALSDEEIKEYLQDDVSGIIFYTPVGLELGINYVMDSQSGWVTATIKDYEKYIRKL